MILGFVSFILALTVEFGASIPYDLFMAFEWAHFLIFACAMLYVANALLASVRTHLSSLLRWPPRATKPRA
jgi:hypothetical protein